jgi:hypothetical protein
LRVAVHVFGELCEAPVHRFQDLRRQRGRELFHGARRLLCGLLLGGDLNNFGDRPVVGTDQLGQRRESRVHEIGEILARSLAEAVRPVGGLFDRSDCRIHVFD